jgi:hypothetical protein
LAGLIKKEIAGRDAEGDYQVIEPFLAEWLQREQRDYAMSDLTRIASATAATGARRARRQRRG